jgi:acyl carrier protein
VSGLDGAGAPALRLSRLDDGAGPPPGALPAAVAVLGPGERGDEELPLVLLGRGGNGALAIDGGPLPLAVLTYGPPAAPAADLDFAVIELGPAEGAKAPAAPLARELERLVELSREARDFVTAELLDGQDSEVSADTPLLELGIVDSVSIVSLVDFVEGELAIPVPEEEIHPRHLADVLSIERLIVKLDAAQRHGRRA